MSKIGNMSFDALKDYVARVATKTINNGQEFNTVVTGIIQQSLPGYYTVTLSNSNDTTVYNAIPLNSTDTFGPQDYVYLVKAPVSSGDHFNTKYYIFGLVSSTNEVYANLSDWERFMADEVQTGVIEKHDFQGLSKDTPEAWIKTLEYTEAEKFFDNINDKGVFAICADFTYLDSDTKVSDYGIRIECCNVEGATCQTAEGVLGIYDLGTGYFTGQPFNMKNVWQKRIIYLDNFTTDVKKFKIYKYIVPRDTFTVFNSEKVMVKNLELQAGSIQDLAGRFSVRISVPNTGKDYFRSIAPTAEALYVVTLQATPYYDSQPLAADSIQYYWFVKDDAIKEGDNQYNSLAGEGWRCLNTYTEETIAGLDGSISGNQVKVWNNKNNIINIDEFGWKITNQTGKICGTVVGWEKIIDNPLLKDYPSANAKGTVPALPTSTDGIKKGDYYIVSGNNIIDAENGGVLVALQDKPTSRAHWSAIKPKVSIKPFDQYENIVKCIVKYQSSIAYSEEYTVRNYAVHQFKAVLNSSSDSNRLVMPTDRITLDCVISDYNELAQSDSYTERYTWIIKGKRKDNQQWEELEHELAKASAVVKTLKIKDDEKAVEHSLDSADKDAQIYLEYELPDLTADGNNVKYERYSVQCFVQIAVDAADNAIELYSNVVEIESITDLAETIKTVYIYKYYISKNMNVAFEKAASDEKWSGDWAVYDVGGIVTDPWSELKVGTNWMEDNPMAADPRAAINYLSNERKAIWPLSTSSQYGNGVTAALGDEPYLYYTRKELLYVYKGDERIDFDPNQEGITPVEEKNWEEPLMLRQVRIIQDGAYWSTEEIKSATEISQINTFNQLTKNGAEDGIFYEENAYIPTTDTSPQEGKTYYTKSGSDYTQYSGTTFANNTVYYEKSPNKNKLYINATYINSGTLRVGDSTTEKFYASIHNPEVKIGGYTVSDTDLMSADDKVGLSSNGSYAFWAGDTDKSNAPFRVNHDGELYATNAHITGHIHANSMVLDNSIKVGAANLAGTSGNLAAIDYVNWATMASSSREGFIYRGTTPNYTPDGGLKIDIPGLETGKKYVLSYQFKILSGSCSKIAGHCGSFNTTYAIVDGVKRTSAYSSGYSPAYDSIFILNKAYQIEVHITKTEGADNSIYIQTTRNFKAGDDGKYAQVEYEVWDIHFEEGDVRSIWQPAKEDSKLLTEFIVDDEQISMRAKNLYLDGQKFMINSPTLQLNWIPEYKNGVWQTGKGHYHGGYFRIVTRYFSVGEDGFITATGGLIGGIKFNDNAIWSTNKNFKVTNAGELTAKSGSIGGLDIATDGGLSFTSGNFALSSTGILNVKKANIQGDLEASSLKISKQGAVNAGLTPINNKNLILNSMINETKAVYGFATRYISEDLVAGQTYTLSIEGSTSNSASTTLQVCIHNTDRSWEQKVSITTDSISQNKITFKMDQKISKDSIQIECYSFQELEKGGDNVTINWMKLEKGDCSTEWTPAPEDVSNANELTTEFVVDTANNMIYLSTKDLAINTARLKLNHNGKTVQDGYFHIETENFKVNESGKITANLGTIGDWHIGQDFQVYEITGNNPYLVLGPTSISKNVYAGLGTYSTVESQDSGILLNPNFIQGHYRIGTDRMEYRFKWEDLVKMWSHFLGVKMGNVTVPHAGSSANSFSQWKERSYTYVKLFEATSNVDYFVFVTPNSSVGSAMLDITTKRGEDNAYYVGVKRSSNHDTVVSYFAIPWSYYNWC